MLKITLSISFLFFFMFNKYSAKAIDYEDISQQLNDLKELQSLSLAELELLQVLFKEDLDTTEVVVGTNEYNKRSYEEQQVFYFNTKKKFQVNNLVIVQKSLNTLKFLLENLQNKGGSAFKSVPYSPNVVDKYVNGYLKQIEELSKKMKPSKRVVDKKAVCGSLNCNF